VKYGRAEKAVKNGKAGGRYELRVGGVAVALNYS